MGIPHAKAAILCAAFFLAPCSAFAATCGSFLNPMTVSATPLAFGIYNPHAGGPTVASATVSIDCAAVLDLLPSFSVALSHGSSGTYAGRTLTGPGTIAYNVYTDNSYATVWGDGTAGTGVQSFSAVLLQGTVTFTGYGRIPTNQAVAIGDYTDNMIVTVTY